MEQLGSLLSSLSLSEYLPQFIENDVDMELLEMLSEEELKRTLKDIGITKVGHQMKIIKAVQKSGASGEFLLSNVQLGECIGGFYKILLLFVFIIF